jgi:hypothetical protein
MRIYKYQILFFIFLVFLLQPLKLGFEQGHHGWVSSHVLAQIRNASPENYFLGFARNAGSWYFDRYPVVFSGLSHLLLSPFWESFETYIYMARQWMNIIYIITSFLIFRICLQFVHKPKALAITFFTISATFFIKYKDMVHFDQPAVLGCLMVLNGIIDFEKYRKKRMLLISSLVGPILGRGYAVIFFLASWVIVKGIYELFFLKKKTITGLKIPILITLVSVPLPATMLSLNIWGEAKIRNLDWDQTSIVVSARKRLGIDSYTEVGKEKKKVETVSFVLNQIYRAFDMVTPYAISGVHFKGYTNKLRHYLTVIPKVIFQIWILFFLFKILPHFWKLTTCFEKYLFNILKQTIEKNIIKISTLNIFELKFSILLAI